MRTSELAGSVTRIAVGPDPEGRRARVVLGADAEPGAPVLRPWLHRTDGSGARVSLVPEGALLLAGDRVRLEVRVADGASLDVVEPAGTVAYSMPAGDAVWDVDVRLGRGASLRWLGRPFVVAEGAVVRRSTRVALGVGSRFLLRETLVLGRSGEGPGTIRSGLRVTGPDRPVLAEDLDLGPVSPPALLGGARVVDSLLLVGADAPEGSEADRLDLEDGSHLWRFLGTSAHESPLGAVASALQRTG